MLFVLLPMLLAGCGNNSVATLSGTVTFNGEIVKKGTVSLMPEDPSGSTAGGPIVDGKYSVPNLKPGKYRISVALEPSGPVILPGSPEANKTLTPAEIKAMTAALPEDAKGNDELIEVTSGEQTKDVTLTGAKLKAAGGK